MATLRRDAKSPLVYIQKSPESESSSAGRSWAGRNHEHFVPGCREELTVLSDRQPEVVTNPEATERQLVFAFLLWDQVPTELGALTVYRWCLQLVELGAGHRLAGFPALMVGNGAS